MTETRKVQPCGMLYSQTREYFLLKPEPIPGDSWERDNAYRWLVVPRQVVEFIDNAVGEYTELYSFARHIVTTAFVVDYAADMPEITIQVLVEVDVTKPSIDITKQEWREGMPDYVPDVPSPYTEEEWERLLAKTDEVNV